MRTDSVNLSPEAIAMISTEIEDQYGKDYLQVRSYNNKSKGAQEAHEAIRPTQMSNKSPNLERDEARLYELIFKRTLASQMSDAQLERTKVGIAASTHDYVFTAHGGK